MNAESGKSFFKQVGWMVVANLGCGLFMFAVHPIAGKMEAAEYGVFQTMLKLFILLGIPAAGLQSVFALQTALAKTATEQADLGAAVRAVLWAMAGVWLVTFLAGLAASGPICETFKISNSNALLATLGLGLTTLLLPVLRGVLQGRQDFAGLGWTLVIDGVGRFSMIVVFVALLGGQAASGMSASLVSQFAALALAAWATRAVWRAPGGGFHWRPWLARVAPLTLGLGAVTFIGAADTLFVQSQFDRNLTRLYGAGVIVGFGLSQFTLPIASVMFPKIAGGTGADAALRHTLLGTAVLGGAVALVCSLVPTLPLRVVYFRNPEEFLLAAPLVPWFVWSILCLVLANVLIQNLLARERFTIVPWLVLIAAGYAAGLAWVQPRLAGMDPMTAFRLVVQVLSVACVSLLGTAVYFTWGRRESSRVQGHIPNS